jgi:hypothetical protein
MNFKRMSTTVFPNTMDVFLSKNYGDYGGYYSTTKSISGIRQKFTWTVSMTKASDPNCRFGFGFGRFSGKVYIDNVSIEKIAVTGSQSMTDIASGNVRIFPNPTDGFPDVTIDTGNLLPTTIDLCNLQGQLVSRLWTGKPLPFGQSFRFNLKEHKIGKGIYFLSKRRFIKVGTIDTFGMSVLTISSGAKIEMRKAAKIGVFGIGGHGTIHVDKLLA